MNKFLSLAAFAILSLTLSSCGMLDSSDDYVGGDFAKLVKGEKDASSTIFMVDNLGIEDIYETRIFRHNGEHYNYTAKGDLNEINIEVRIECDDNGGTLTVFCGTYDEVFLSNGPKIVFKNLDGNKMTHRDGYVIKMLDSLTVQNKTYKDVFEFDASDVEDNECIYDKLYIAAKEGLVQIDLQDSITIERKP